MLHNGLSRQPDFDQFLKVLWRKGKPSHLPFYEHIASPHFIATRMGVPVEAISWQNPAFPKLYVDFWIGMGYDCVPMDTPPFIRMPEGHHKASEGSEALAVIRTMEDFEKFPWPDEENPVDFQYMEKVSPYLPDGAKIITGVEFGPFEWVSRMMGMQGLSLAIYTQPELVSAIFEKFHRLHTSALRKIARVEQVGALRQGDDLGFKTSTFLSPEHLRKYIFPSYKEMVRIGHDEGKPFLLHCCGQVAEVYDDLIDYCKFDAKHSFEDVIMPVDEFKRQYGRRITPLGGLDVDKICRMEKGEIRTYARAMIEKCWAEDRYWALGTGNSLTDYMPVENYLVVLEEGVAASA